jgi:hypothetical protein
MEAQDPRPGDFSNVLGVQEVHWVMSESRCRELFNKLRREGENFENAKFFQSGMPGARKQGHCKLIGPSARDDRFVDRRYETDT